MMGMKLANLPLLKGYWCAYLIRKCIIHTYFRTYVYTTAFVSTYATVYITAYANV